MYSDAPVDNSSSCLINAFEVQHGVSSKTQVDLVGNQLLLEPKQE